MDGIIKQIQKDPESKKELQQGFQRFLNLNLTSQAEAGKTLYIKHTQMEKAAEIVEETIVDLIDENDDLKNENGILSNKLEQYGEYNKEEVDTLIISKRKSRTNQENKQRILQRLQQTLDKSEKAIKN